MENKSTTHLDSSVIIAYMNTSDRDQYEYGHSVVYRLRKERERGNATIVISSTALAEVLLWIAERPKPTEAVEAVHRFRELFEALDPKIVWPDEEVCECAGEIRERDYEIEHADSIITAHALLDPDSIRLVTTDQQVIKSRAVDEMNAKLVGEEGRRRRKLRIGENP